MFFTQVLNFVSKYGKVTAALSLLGSIVSALLVSALLGIPDLHVWHFIQVAVPACIALSGLIAFIAGLIMISKGQKFLAPIAKEADTTLPKLDVTEQFQNLEDHLR